MKRLDLPEEPLRLLGEPVEETKEAKKPSPEVTAEMRRMEAALAKLMACMTDPSVASGRDITPALDRLARTAKGKPIEEVRVANWIKAEKIDEALAALAHNGELVPATVVRAYETPAYEPLLLVVRAARYSFQAPADRPGRKVLPADVVRTSFESFQQVSVADAQQLARLINGREAQAAKTAAA